MFKNAGEKIRIVSITFFWIMIAGNIISAIMMFNIGSNEDDSFYIYGFLTLMIGPLISWVMALLLYGFSRIVNSAILYENVVKGNINNDMKGELKEDAHRVETLKNNQHISFKINNPALILFISSIISILIKILYLFSYYFFIINLVESILLIIFFSIYFFSKNSKRKNFLETGTMIFIIMCLVYDIIFNQFNQLIKGEPVSQVFTLFTIIAGIFTVISIIYYMLLLYKKNKSEKEINISKWIIYLMLGNCLIIESSFSFINYFLGYSFFSLFLLLSILPLILLIVTYYYYNKGAYMIEKSIKISK